MRTSLLVVFLIWPSLVNDFSVLRFSKSNLPVLWALDVVHELILVATLAGLHHFRVINLRALLARPRTELQRQFALPPTRLPILVIVAAGLCCFSGLINYQVIDRVVFSLFPSSGYRYEFPETQPVRSIAILYAAATAGFFEELIYRGIIQQRLQAQLPLARAVLLTAVIFGSIHWYQGPAGAISAALWAVPAGIYFAAYQNLWVVMLWHAFYDIAIWTGILNW